MNKKSGPAIIFLLYVLFVIVSARAIGVAQEVNEGNKEPAPAARKAIAAETEPAHMAGLMKTMALREVFNTREAWQASAYEVRSGAKDGHKWGPARLCFTSGPSLKGGYCYEVRDGNNIYETVEEMSLVPMYNEKEPAYALYFVAQGAHNRSLASLWTYRKEEKRFVNIAPPLAYPNRVGGSYLPRDVRPDMEGLIVLADSDPGYIGTGETFACHVRVFRYSDKSRRFEPVGPGYATTTKYEYFQVEREMENIKKYLVGTLPSPVPEGTKEKEVAEYLVDTLPLGRVFNISKEWQATTYDYLAPGPAHEDVGPAARLCFSGPRGESCFEAVTGTGEKKWVYNTGGMSLVPLFSDREPAFGLLYEAGGVAWGGRDLGNLVTLWTYSRERQKFVNVLPPIEYPSLLGAFALLSDLRPGMEGICALAYYVQGKGEGRMNAHRYRINLYRYSRRSGMFEPADSFVTRDKYDDSGLQFIFRTEMRGIERLVRAKGLLRKK